MGALPGISCDSAFHGRTFGALIFTFSKEVQKTNFPELPVKRIKFCKVDSDPQINLLESLLKENKVAFILTEIIQEERGLMQPVNSLSKTLENYQMNMRFP